MYVTQVTVSVSEKRAHPFEHANYAASVTLTASLEPNESPDRVVTDLQYRASRAVMDECGEWENGVKEQKLIDDVFERLHYIYRELAYAIPAKQPSCLLKEPFVTSISCLSTSLTTGAKYCLKNGKNGLHALKR